MDSIAKYHANIDADIFRISQWLAVYLQGLVWDSNLLMGGVPYKDGHLYLNCYDIPAFGGTWRTAITEGNQTEVVTVWANDVPMSLGLAPKTLITVECFHPALVPIYEQIVNELDTMLPKPDSSAESEARTIRRAIGSIGAPVTTSVLEDIEPLLTRPQPVAVETLYVRRIGGNSHFATACDYERAVLEAMDALLRAGSRKLTQQEVGQHFCDNPPLPYVDLHGRQFRRWNDMYGLTWGGLKEKARGQYKG